MQQACCLQNLAGNKKKKKQRPSRHNGRYSDRVELWMLQGSTFETWTSLLSRYHYVSGWDRFIPLHSWCYWPLVPSCCPAPLMAHCWRPKILGDSETSLSGFGYNGVSFVSPWPLCSGALGSLRFGGTFLLETEFRGEQRVQKFLINGAFWPSWRRFECWSHQLHIKIAEWVHPNPCCMSMLMLF